MTVSEFWFSLDTVFGSVLGRSLVSDLVLPGFGVTAVEALAADEAPFEVWKALVVETGVEESALWVHRQQ